MSIDEDREGHIDVQEFLKAFLELKE